MLRSILPGVGLAEVCEELGQEADRLNGEGVTKRLKGIGEALFVWTKNHPKRSEIYEALASHQSDMVRVWANYMLTADQEVHLAHRLEATRRFAADRSVAVRECAWDSFRPYVVADLDGGFRLLEPWVRDPDPNIRRCAIEGTRPRGVWTAHIEDLKQDPEPALALLEPVRSDPSPYVQRSAATGSTTPVSPVPTGSSQSAPAVGMSLLRKRQPGSLTTPCGPFANVGKS